MFKPGFDHYLFFTQLIAGWFISETKAKGTWIYALGGYTTVGGDSLTQNSRVQAKHSQSQN